MNADPSRPGDVDAVIVNWNGRRYLARAIDALRRSTIPVRIIVVDNASDDGSADYVRAAHPDVEVVAAASNVGYAGGANLGLRASRARYAFVMNPDLLVAPDHLERLRDRLEREPAIGAAQGRLYRITPEQFEAGALPTDVLDSAGHVMRRSRMVVDRGQGDADGARWDVEVSVFSACGAGLFLRRAMLDRIARGDRWLDEAFFAYKEDIDLGWRARLFGWDVRYVPDALAWHVRALPGPGRRGHGAPAFARRHSWMNHWLMIVKNDTATDVLRHAPWILGWELVRLGHALLRDPALLPAYVRVWTLLPDTLRERRFIQAGRRASRADVRRWFGADSFPPSTPADTPR